MTPDNPLHDYNVLTAWSQASDRLGGSLMPFAELFAGDMLCFDYENAGRPTVVVWDHEMSEPDQPPRTEFVAENFDKFLPLLYRMESDPKRRK